MKYEKAEAANTQRSSGSTGLAWSSVLLALGNVKEVGAVVDRPKALGDIRGITYIYGMFYRFGLIDIPEMAKEASCWGRFRERKIVEKRKFPSGKVTQLAVCGILGQK